MKSCHIFNTATLALLCSITVVGCAPRDMGTASTWQALHLYGKTLELIDPIRIETYHFLENGFVAASAGDKDGEVAAPVLYWKIKDNNLLIAEDSSFKNFESFSSPHLNGDIITVQRGALRWSQYKLGH